MRDPPLILTVDDTPENLEILRMRLEAQGYQVVEAADGEEGLARARELKPDLILLDINMPRMSGLEVCRVLKADPATAGIKIVMLTASGSDEDRTRAFDAAADDYFMKPFSPIKLLDKVYDLLG